MAHQPRRCAPRPSAVGVQDARTSRSAVGAGPASSPKRVDAVCVIVPPIAVYAAECCSSASVSQVQATAGSNGSPAMSGSSSAVTRVTSRRSPCQASCPAGSCSRISRPLATSSPERSTVALNANENGASRCGAAISSSRSSGRGAAARSPSTARVNASGAAEGVAMPEAYAADRCQSSIAAPRVGKQCRRRPAVPQPGRRPWQDDAVTLDDSAFVRACRRQDVPHTPVWFMRQAGRSLPEYRKVREGISMLESCRRPDLVTEITLQPVRRHNVDAAVLYSDIVVPIAAAGIDLDIVPGTGPVIAEPIRTSADLQRLRPITDEDVSFVAESVRLLVGELGKTP